jgi:hypothetical protein
MTLFNRLACSATGLLLLIALPGLYAQAPGYSPSEHPPDPTCPVADGPSSDPTYNIRKHAFDAIDAGNSPVARHLMRCAIDDDHADKIALRQEVYLDLDAGDARGAIGDIDALRALGAADAQLEAQEGYIYAEKKNYTQAKAAFRRAIETGDSNIRFQSFQALRNLGSESPSRNLQFDVDSQYLNRFDDGIVDATMRLNQRLGHDSPFEIYLNERLLRDTASKVGPLPQIFDDNAFLTGVGLEFQPPSAHYSLTAEANEAYVFYAGRNNTAALVPDFRTVAGYFNIFRPGGADSRFSITANGSVGFYSRYQHDVIAYLQPQENFDIVKSGPVRIAPYLQESIALDTNQQYYNNIGEIIPGVGFYFKHLGGLALYTEYARGYYLPFHSNSVNPYGSSYNDFRVRLTFSKTISLERGGR